MILNNDEYLFVDNILYYTISSIMNKDYIDVSTYNEPWFNDISDVPSEWLVNNRLLYIGNGTAHIYIDDKLHIANYMFYPRFIKFKREYSIQKLL